jgi:N-acyl-D-amino-acid deacylase
MPFDILLRNGLVIDGTKSPAFRADVGIVGDQIAGVGELADSTAGRTIDTQGLVVAPGFIDVHNHSDGWMWKIGQLTPKTTQGFTTEVIMADGISYAPVDRSTAAEWMFYLRSLNGLQTMDYDGWQTLGEYVARFAGNSAQNVAFHVPYANVRALVCGFGRQAVDDFQMRQIQAEIRRGMEEGAVGVSTGLDYIVQCFSGTRELADACRVVADYQGIYVTHVRYKMGLLPALREAIEISRSAGIGLHVSHLKIQSPYTDEQVFACLEEASRDIDVTFDIYPYQPGSTMLNYLLPYEVWEEGPLAALGKLNDPAIRRRFRQGLPAYRLDLNHIRIAWLPGRDNAVFIGKTLAEFVSDVGLRADDAIFNLLVEERLAVLCVMDEGDDQQVWPYVQHERCMVGSDGIYFPDGKVHPRMFGTTGRILGRCVRELKLFPLEEAVHKLSGFPAARFGLSNRGVIREGAAADLVVFDPNRVADEATFADPQQPTVGIHHVLVNGTPILADQAPIDRFDAGYPGRVLKAGFGSH